MKKSNHFPATTLIVFSALIFTMEFFFIKPLVAQDGNTFWVGVQNAGINSHQAGRPWCPEGSFLVALDLDGPRNLSPHDSPVVGQAMCRRAGYRWSERNWFPVESSGINSHQAGRAWCPAGRFLVALDLDGPRNYSPYDSPIVGQAMYAGLAGRAANRWGSCFWVGVENAGINSHQPGRAWCPDGTYLVALDLDGPRDISPYDSPVVGQAMCCSLP